MKNLFFLIQVYNNDEEQWFVSFVAMNGPFLTAWGNCKLIVNRLRSSTKASRLCQSYQVDELSKKKQEAIASLDYSEFKADKSV